MKEDYYNNKILYNKYILFEENEYTKIHKVRSSRKNDEIFFTLINKEDIDKDILNFFMNMAHYNFITRVIVQNIDDELYVTAYDLVHSNYDDPNNTKNNVVFYKFDDLIERLNRKYRIELINFIMRVCFMNVIFF